MGSPLKAECYLCQKVATTKDHIPPKCFFPQNKYLPPNSPNYRNKLITVPSCEEHNNHRSVDDEYTAVAIAMNADSELSNTVFKSKILKQLCRNEGSLGRKFFERARTVLGISKKNNIFIPYETVAIAYEIERIHRVIESIARALYYHESQYKNKWQKDCIIRSPNFLNRDLTRPSDFDFLRSGSQTFTLAEQYPELELEKKGSNPEVFYYQFFKPKESVIMKSPDYLIRMVFYQNMEFFALLY